MVSSLSECLLSHRSCRRAPFYLFGDLNHVEDQSLPVCCVKCFYSFLFCVSTGEGDQPITDNGAELEGKGAKEAEEGTRESGGEQTEAAGTSVHRTDAADSPIDPLKGRFTVGWTGVGCHIAYYCNSRGSCGILLMSHM